MNARHDMQGSPGNGQCSQIIARFADDFGGGERIVSRSRQSFHHADDFGACDAALQATKQVTDAAHDLGASLTPCVVVRTKGREGRGCGDTEGGCDVFHAVVLFCC